MQSFKLACTPKCSSPKCRPKKSPAKEGIEKLYDGLLAGSYVLCSCLIVYSLLMLNTSFLGQDRLSVAIKPVAVAITQAGSSVMDLAADIGSPLNGTINVYSSALTKTFVVTGDSLAKVPELLTWVPPVRARTQNNSYW